MALKTNPGPTLHQQYAMEKRRADADRAAIARGERPSRVEREKALQAETRKLEQNPAYRKNQKDLAAAWRSAKENNGKYPSDSGDFWQAATRPKVK